MGAIGDKFASGEGIQDALVRSHAMLFQNDEMDGVLRQINLDHESRRESIPNILLTLYTSANDVYPIRVKAGQKEAIHIDQPHLTLFGTATPQFFYESLSQRMLTNGFFARMIIIDVGRRGTGQSPGTARHVPPSILDDGAVVERVLAGHGESARNPSRAPHRAVHARGGRGGRATPPDDRGRIQPRRGGQGRGGPHGVEQDVRERHQIGARSTPAARTTRTR